MIHFMPIEIIMWYNFKDIITLPWDIQALTHVACSIRRSDDRIDAKALKKTAIK